MSGRPLEWVTQRRAVAAAVLLCTTAACAALAPVPDADGLAVAAPDANGGDGRGADGAPSRVDGGCRECGDGRAATSDAGAEAGMAILASGQTPLSAIVARDGFVYWGTRLDARSGATGTAQKVAKLGGFPEVLYAPPNGDTTVADVRVTSTQVIVATDRPDLGVLSMAPTGGPARRLCTGVASALAVTVDEAEVFFALSASPFASACPSNGVGTVVTGLDAPARAIATSTDALFAATGSDETDGAIWKGSLATAALTKLVTPVSSPRMLLATDSDLLWVDDGPGAAASPRLVRYELGIGKLTVLLDGVGAIGGFARDADHVYVTTFEAVGTLLACPLTGCGAGGAEARVLAASQPFPEKVAVDEDSVYFSVSLGQVGGSTAGSAQLRRVAK